MFARTERLLLRPGWAEDAPALFDAIADEAIVRNLASAPWPYSPKDAKAFLDRERADGEATFLLFRRTLEAPQLVGSAGLGTTPDGGSELGYWIARPYWGLGYATEASRAIIDIARNGLRLKRIEAGHFTDNPASGRVLEKLGFKATGNVAPRYSAGRRTAAPCKLFTLDLRAEAGDEDELAEVATDLGKAFCMAA